MSGQHLGPYRLEMRIGRGSFGQVYRARHLALGVPRAIKVMHAPVGAQPELAARFLREARMAARLSVPRPHPNVVAVLDHGVENGIQYLVMEYIDCITLADLLQRVPRAARRTEVTLRRCVWDIAGALDYAHSRGVIHRDLKPSNILIENGSGRALLTDFGIASTYQDEDLTQAEQSLGTYAYMSPEQCESALGLTAASDVYSFAALLYEIASGLPPFGRGLPAVAGHLNRPVPPIRCEGGPERDVNGVLARGLAKAPPDRQASARDLARAFLPAFFSWTRGPDVIDQAALAESRRRAQPFTLIGAGARRLWRTVLGHRLLSGCMVLSAALAGIAAIAMVAHPPTGAPTDAPLPAVTPAAASLGQLFRLGSLQLHVVSVTPAVDPKAPGDRVLAITVSYRDMTGGTAVVSPYDWVVTDAQENVYAVIDETDAAGLPQTTLRPGRVVTGVLRFSIPTGARSLILHFDGEIGDEAVTVDLDEVEDGR